MRHLSMPLFFLWAWFVAGPVHALSVAFYYGGEWLPELAAFDIAVVEPRHGFAPDAARRPGFEPFAYVSVGELSGDHPAVKGLPTICRLAYNPAWNSIVLDHSRAECRGYWLTQVFAPLWNAGWRGFFLDTMDSYQLAKQAAATEQQAGLTTLIRELKARHPGLRLMLNRGFELLPQIAPLVEAVAAESLFGRYEPASRSYAEVPAADREWLLARFKEVRERYGLPVVAIDYAPPEARERARAIARRIAELGVVPWVSDGELLSLGVGVREALPRTLLVLYDAREAPDLNYLEAHRFLELPAQYLGLRVRYQEMTSPLSTEPQAGRLAGVVVWGTGELANPQPVLEWLGARRKEGIPILLMGTLPFDPAPALGTRRVNLPGGTGLHSSLAQFEAPLPRRLVTSVQGLQADGIDAWVQGGGGALVGLASWGGFALAPALIEAVPGVDQYRWLIPPFALLRTALRLPDWPVPDVTTETGRRLLTIHVDGDGFVSRAELPGRPWAGEVLLGFLKKHPLPHGISVIEGEIGPTGLYPQHSAELEGIARRIFALPWVEAASHSFSHPFRWAEATAQAGEGEGRYTLPIAGYVFDARREILGSREYLAHLLPAGKTVRLFFWTGDCAPTVEQLRLTREAGLLNINGGDTIISRTCPSLTCVAPYSLAKDGELQVYAPVSNENLFTNLWTGPFWGYRRVIETFERTETPHRLKPVGIYYHFYSATKPAALKALEEVYGWAQSQPLHPVFISEYVEKVRDFLDYAIAREGEAWILRGRGALATVRLEEGLASPDLGASQNVAGFKRALGRTYVHLTGTQARIVLAKAEARATLPHLEEANARITLFKREGRDLRLSLLGHVPVEAGLFVPEDCKLRAEPAARLGPRVEGVQIIKSKHATLTLTVHCPRP
ncbi:bifunctional glycoside hydrolase 114/ polysaccharide deacetylase family protein [Thiobacter aerophilum]|uniref:Endo alpha-1,4 polygalactosaminidase n=1 Tax=Thiobacter aerophilum TaxID=3121275 RepID=A0ABV0EIV3_9BURK